MPSRCWLCVHCDVQEVVDMMRFVEEKSAVMHIDVLTTEIASSLQDSYPDDKDDLTEEHIKQHIARHVVTPVASITRITRDLLDICETLRPNVQSLQNKRRRVERRGQDQPSGPAAEDGGDDAEPKTSSEEEVGTYLRTVGQVMQIYRLHSRMLQAPG
eukprot:2751162-Rhodomonas_salina.1